jgi:adenylate cyclase
MSEIERKFLVATRPSDLEPGEPLRQAYIAVDGPTEVRIRATRSRCTLTVKGGHGLERAEVETAIERDAFDELWPLARGRQIDKVRHRVDLGGVTAEVDIYTGALAGLEVVEVEFASVDDANRFTPPTWFGRELTGEPGWSNASLATAGRPA